MNPNDVLFLTLHCTLPDNQASVPSIRHCILIRRLRTIFDVEAKRGVDEIQIIVGFRPEDGDLGNGLLTQLGLVLH